MKQFIKDYFTFNKAEKNGIIVLIILIILVLSATFIIGRLDWADNPVNTEVDNEIDRFTDTPKGNNVPWDIANIPHKIEFPLDINTADSSMLAQLTGIGPALASRIIRYRDSVGRFDSIAQLLQVKGIGEKKLEGFKNEVIIGAVGQVNLADEN